MKVPKVIFSLFTISAILFSFVPSSYSGDPAEGAPSGSSTAVIGPEGMAQLAAILRQAFIDEWFASIERAVPDKITFTISRDDLLRRVFDALSEYSGEFWYDAVVETVEDSISGGLTVTIDGFDVSLDFSDGSPLGLSAVPHEGGISIDLEADLSAVISGGTLTVTQTERDSPISVEGGYVGVTISSPQIGVQITANGNELADDPEDLTGDIDVAVGTPTDISVRADGRLPSAVVDLGVVKIRIDLESSILESIEKALREKWWSAVSERLEEFLAVKISRLLTSRFPDTLFVKTVDIDNEALRELGVLEPGHTATARNRYELSVDENGRLYVSVVNEIIIDAEFDSAGNVIPGTGVTRTITAPDPSATDTVAGEDLDKLFSSIDIEVINRILAELFLGTLPNSRDGYNIRNAITRLYNKVYYETGPDLTEEDYEALRHWITLTDENKYIKHLLNKYLDEIKAGRFTAEAQKSQLLRSLFNYLKRFMFFKSYRDEGTGAAISVVAPPRIEIESVEGKDNTFDVTIEIYVAGEVGDVFTLRGSGSMSVTFRVEVNSDGITITLPEGGFTGMHLFREGFVTILAGIIDELFLGGDFGESKLADQLRELFRGLRDSKVTHVFRTLEFTDEISAGVSVIKIRVIDGRIEIVSDIVQTTDSGDQDSGLTDQDVLIGVVQDGVDPTVGADATGISPWDRTSSGPQQATKENKKKKKKKDPDPDEEGDDEDDEEEEEEANATGNTIGRYEGYTQEAATISTRSSARSDGDIQYTISGGVVFSDSDKPDAQPSDEQVGADSSSSTLSSYILSIYSAFRSFGSDQEGVTFRKNR